MMRIAVMVLVAANLLFLGWSQWIDRGQPRLSAVATATTPAAARPAPPPPCATLGPFPDETQAEQARQLLTTAGWGVVPRDVTAEVREGWWVYVANPDTDSQTRTLNAIRRAGIADAFAMPVDEQFRVSVGIFSDETRAEDRAGSVQRLQLDAVVAERNRAQSVTWFDIPGVARETLADGRLAGTGLALERLRVETCPPASTP